jgi:hypothetical protein
MIRRFLLSSLFASVATIAVAPTASADPARFAVVTPLDQTPVVAMPSEGHQAVGWPIDLDRWCQARYGPFARAVVRRPNVYGWVCFVDGREFPIDVADAARMEYGPLAKVAFRDWNDPYSWYAYFD